MGQSKFTNWEEIEKLAIAGVDYPELARRFDMKANTIRTRALRHKWPTPHAIAQRRLELSKPGTVDLIQAAAEDWNSKGEAHRKEAFAVASESIKMFKVRAPKNFRELKAADDVARRAAGLDISEINNQTLIMMHERLNSFEDDQPEEVNPVIDAEIVIEPNVKIGDSSPKLPDYTESAPAADTLSDTHD